MKNNKLLIYVDLIKESSKKEKVSDIQDEITMILKVAIEDEQLKFIDYVTLSEYSLDVLQQLWIYEGLILR